MFMKAINKEKAQSHEINIPLLVLNAADDPLVPPSSVPWDLTTWHSSVIQVHSQSYNNIISLLKSINITS